MKRRDFVKGGLTAWAAAEIYRPFSLAHVSSEESNRAGRGQVVAIENGLYRLEVDAERGLIQRIFDKAGKVELIAEPRLADNFRLLLPLPGLEANYIFGPEQQASSVEKTATELAIDWRGPLKNAKGAFDLDVFARIALVEKSIHFRLDVRNRTDYQLAEVWYPVLGGIRGIGEREDTQEVIPSAGASTQTNLFRRFPPMAELGIPFAECFWSYPFPMPMPWIDVYNHKLNRGMYFACHDEICRFKTLRFELHPGVMERQYGDNWPRPEDLGAEFPQGLKVHWTHFPHTRPGETFQGPPVVIQFHDGDWHHAAKVYRDWFKAHFSILDPSKSWMRQEMAFQDSTFLGPEGIIHFRFQDIPEWARAAREYGVKSVIVNGWMMGGHDGGYPDYTPDPRLGTWNELAEGIRECHKMDVKVFLFANIQPVDVATDWYTRDLHRYVSMDKWGVPAKRYGFGFDTLGARLGYTCRPLVDVSPGFAEYRGIIVRQMAKLAEIGADGVHFDKLWPQVGLDFNPELKISPDEATSEGKLQALKETLEACRKINPGFALSTESAWDRTLSFANVAWAWHHNAADHLPVFKFTFPEWLPGLIIWQYGYTPVNNAVRYGYQMFIAPGHGNMSMKYGPMMRLSSYISEVLRLLAPLRDTIYLGEFLDTLEVRFNGPDDSRYSAFRNRITGKRACVVANLSPRTRDASVIAFDGNETGPVRVYQPFREPRNAILPVVMEIPSERFAIVVEV